MNLLPKELITSQYRDEFKAYLTARAAAHAHNQRIVDDFILTIKPVTVTKLLLATGQTVTALGYDTDHDGFWDVAQGRSIEQWKYFKLAGRSAPITVDPASGNDPFYYGYINFHNFGVELQTYLLAGTNTIALEKELASQMIALPESPARPDGMEWYQINPIEQAVRNELNQPEEAPF